MRVGEFERKTKKKKKGEEGEEEEGRGGGDVGLLAGNGGLLCFLEKKILALA